MRRPCRDLECHLKCGFHIPNHFIYGYSSGAAIIGGFVRGDDDITTDAYSKWDALVIAHQAIPVPQNSAPPRGEAGYSIMKNVPTIAEYAAAHPPKTQNERAEIATLNNIELLNVAYDVPVGTPVKFQTALNDAIEFASTRRGAEEQMIQNGLALDYQLPEQIRSKIAAVIKQQPQLTKWLAATGAQPRNSRS